MTASDHIDKAEDLADSALITLSHGAADNGLAEATLAQVHATLAVAYALQPIVKAIDEAAAKACGCHECHDWTHG